MPAVDGDFGPWVAGETALRSLASGWSMLDYENHVRWTAGNPEKKRIIVGAAVLGPPASAAHILY